jgi:SAM-dependent methyltransferase
MTQKNLKLDFLIASNDNPGIVVFNLKTLLRNYPDSPIYLYDWGYRKKYLDEFVKANTNVKIISWRKANITNFMYNKVLCIKDYYDSSRKNRLVYIDADVIIYKKFDEIFNDNWDVGAIWRPDYSVFFETEQWLNAGTIFFNNIDIGNVQKFIDLWKQKCDKWDNKAWWLDQVELINIFKDTNGKFRDNCGLIRSLPCNGSNIRLKTFSWYNYNFYPGAGSYFGTGYKRLGKNKDVKIIHFKSPKRKQLFNLLPDFLLEIWLSSFGKKVFEQSCRLFFNSVLNADKLKNKIIRKYLKWKYDTDSEIYYWKVAQVRKKPLYDFAYFRANEILKIFYELNNFQEISYGEKAIDVGPGPCGGVLDLLEAKEKWLAEPCFDEYQDNNVWFSKSKDLTIRKTTAEAMKDVPENYFDSVFAINSIDHGDNIRICFDNIYKILKKDGHFYLHVHCRTPEQTNELHTQSFNGDELKIMLADSGFKIEIYHMFDEDPLSSTYNTFIGILRK